MGDGSALDEDTTPNECGCAACLERARMRDLVASAHITRLTTIHSLDSAGPPWTVFVVQGGRVNALGRGYDEEQALYEALRVLGVVS